MDALHVSCDEGAKAPFEKSYEGIDWPSLYYYDPCSPSGLRHSVSKLRGSNYKIVAAEANSVAGYIGEGEVNRYWVVSGGDGKIYLAHKVVWILHGRKLEDGQYLDHVDGDRSNNRVENLRAVSHAVNCRNRPKRPDNKSGKTGVSLNVTTKSAGWRAQCFDLEGKLIRKCFSIRKHGNDLAFEMACAWRDEAIRKLNEQGAGYTDRHGKE